MKKEKVKEIIVYAIVITIGVLAIWCISLRAEQINRSEVQQNERFN